MPQFCKFNGGGHVPGGLLLNYATDVCCEVSAKRYVFSLKFIEFFSGFKCFFHLRNCSCNDLNFFRCVNNTKNETNRFIFKYHSKVFFFSKQRKRSCYVFVPCFESFISLLQIHFFSVVLARRNIVDPKRIVRDLKI